MTRIAICADLHVDDYDGIPGRFEDILGTVRWVARTAREQACEVLVIAGDYTESRTAARAPRVVKIAHALEEGPDRQVHVEGNHDARWQGESIVTDLARTPGWTGVTAPHFELVDDVAICAIPFLERSFWRAEAGNELKPETQAYRELGEAYVVQAQALYARATAAGAKAAILVGHQQLAGADMTDKQRSFMSDVDLVVDARALAAIGYRAVVFGHVHRAQTIVGDPGCPVLYAGSIERVDFAEELEEKSFVVLDIEPEDIPGRAPRTRLSWQRIPTPARRYVTFHAAAPNDDEASAEVADSLLEGYVRDAIVRVVDVGPEHDPAAMRRQLEAAGAFAITSIHRAPVQTEASARAMDETLSAEQALGSFFEDDPDRDALVELGRELLAEVAA